MNINKFMKQLTRETERMAKAAEKALDETAAIALADMKRNAAVDTGKMRRSIRMSKSKKNFRIVWILEVEVEYGMHVEFGTSRQTAQPFFRPAMNTARIELPKRIKKKINKEV